MDTFCLVALFSPRVHSDLTAAKNQLRAASLNQRAASVPPAKQGKHAMPQHLLSKFSSLVQHPRQCTVEYNWRWILQLGTNSEYWFEYTSLSRNSGLNIRPLVDPRELLSCAGIFFWRVQVCGSSMQWNCCSQYSTSLNIPLRHPMGSERPLPDFISIRCLSQNCRLFSTTRSTHFGPKLTAVTWREFWLAELLASANRKLLLHYPRRCVRYAKDFPLRRTQKLRSLLLRIQSNQSFFLLSLE